MKTAEVLVIVLTLLAFCGGGYLLMAQGQNHDLGRSILFLLVAGVPVGLFLVVRKKMYGSGALLALLGMLTAITLPSNHLAGNRADLHACHGNLKTIGVVLERYVEDHQQNAPEKLDDLVPDYILVLPTCPAGKSGYVLRQFRETVPEGRPHFLVICQGEHHSALGKEPDFPRYDSLRGLCP